MTRRVAKWKEVSAKWRDVSMSEEDRREARQMFLDQVRFYGAMMHLPNNVIVMHIGTYERD